MGVDSGLRGQRSDGPLPQELVERSSGSPCELFDVVGVGWDRLAEDDIDATWADAPISCGADVPQPFEGHGDDRDLRLGGQAKTTCVKATQPTITSSMPLGEHDEAVSGSDHLRSLFEGPTIELLVPAADRNLPKDSDTPAVDGNFKVRLVLEASMKIGDRLEDDEEVEEAHMVDAENVAPTRLEMLEPVMDHLDPCQIRDAPAHELPPAVVATPLEYRLVSDNEQPEPGAEVSQAQCPRGDAPKRFEEGKRLKVLDMKVQLFFCHGDTLFTARAFGLEHMVENWGVIYAQAFDEVKQQSTQAHNLPSCSPMV